MTCDRQPASLWSAACGREAASPPSRARPNRSFGRNPDEIRLLRRRSRGRRRAAGRARLRPVARPDPHRRLVDRVPLHPGGRRAVRRHDRPAGAGRRVDRHRRRHADLLRRRRHRLPRHHRRLAGDEGVRVRALHGQRRRQRHRGAARLRRPFDRPFASTARTSTSARRSSSRRSPPRSRSTADRRQPLQELERDRPVAARRRRSRSSARRRPRAPATPSSSSSCSRAATSFPAIAALEEDRKEEVCERMRQDGPFIEAGENDNLIVQRLEADPNALGIFGYSFLFENTDKLKAVAVDGVAPDAETIASGEYGVSRPLFIYVKNAHRGVIPGLDDFLDRVRLRGELRPGRLPARARPDPARRRRARGGPRRGRGRRQDGPLQLSRPRPGARAAPRRPPPRRGDRGARLSLPDHPRCCRSPPTSSARRPRAASSPPAASRCTRCRATTAPSSRSGSACPRWCSCCSGCVAPGQRDRRPAAAQPARRLTAGAAAARRRPAPLRDPQRRRRAASSPSRRPRSPPPPSGSTAGRRIARARAVRRGARRDARSASSSPAPASRRASAPATAVERALVGLHDLLLGGRDPHHRRHHRLARLRGLGLLRAGAAARLLLRPAAGSRRSPSAPTRSPAPAPSARCRSSSAPSSSRPSPCWSPCRSGSSPRSTSSSTPPTGCASVVKPLLEILAGVPTVVYGFFAVLTVAPGDPPAPAA